MPRGFLSKIIYTLLGASEHEKKEAPAGKPANSGAKEWVPDLTHQKREETVVLQKEHRGIMGMLERIYVKATHFLSESFKKNVFVAAPVLAAILILLAFTPLVSYMRAFLIIIVLIIAAALSKLIQKLFPFVVGFDLCLFFTVLAGVAYHPIVGMAVGVFSSALGSVARGQYDMDKVIVPLIGYITVALTLPMIPFSDVFYIGMASALIYAVLMSVIFGFTMGFCPLCLFNTATFFVSSVGFHYWLFRNYAASFLGFLAG